MMRLLCGILAALAAGMVGGALAQAPATVPLTATGARVIFHDAFLVTHDRALNVGLYRDGVTPWIDLLVRADDGRWYGPERLDGDDVEAAPLPDGYRWEATGAIRALPNGEAWSTVVSSTVVSSTVASTAGEDRVYDGEAALRGPDGRTVLRLPVRLEIYGPNGRLGLEPLRPLGLPRRDLGYALLRGEPVVRAVEEGRLEVAWETTRPTPAAVLFFGFYEPDGRLALPRWLLAVHEPLDGTATRHAIRFRPADLEAPRYAALGLVRPGAVLPYRLEMWDPEADAARAFEGRFELRDGELAPTVTLGPFVSDVGPTSAVLSWETDRAVTATVRLRGEGADLAVVAAPGPATRFEVRLEGLRPGRDNAYRVEITDGVYTTTTREYSVAPSAPDAVRLTFAVMGDSQQDIGGADASFNGVNAAVLGALSRDALNRGAELVVHLGDMVTGYVGNAPDLRAQLRTFKQVMEPVWRYLPVYTVKGNHESVADAWEDGSAPGVLIDRAGDESPEAVLAGEFANPDNGPPPEAASAPTYSENAYWFDRAGVRFIVLNDAYWSANQAARYGGTPEGYVMDGQLAWLKGVLAAADGDPSIRHVFLLAHVPLADGPVEPAALAGDGGIRAAMAARHREVWAAFAAGDKAVAGLFGHEHYYSRAPLDLEPSPASGRPPVWRIVTGGAGGHLYVPGGIPAAGPDRAFSARRHYCLFTIDGPRVTLDVYAYTGELIDHAELR